MEDNHTIDVPFSLHAEKARLSLTGSGELLSAGMSGVIPVHFSFSEDWNGLEKTAVFSNGSKTVRVEEAQWSDGTCILPAEVLAIAGKTVMAGVYGCDGLRLVLPTIWCVLGRVEPATDLSGEQSRPGTGLNDLISRLDSLETDTQDLQASLSGALLRVRQAARTQAHTERVAADESGALWVRPGGVKTIAASFNGSAYSYYGADFEFSTVDEIMAMGQNGQQIRLAILGSSDVYALSHQTGAASTARLYFTGITWAADMTRPTLDVFEINSLMEITRVSHTDLAAFYLRPAAGIPSADLASAVQTGLQKAGSALQPNDPPLNIELTAASVTDGATVTTTATWNQIREAINAQKRTVFYKALSNGWVMLFTPMNGSAVSESTATLQLMSVTDYDGLGTFMMVIAELSPAENGMQGTLRLVTLKTQVCEITVTKTGGTLHSDKTLSQIKEAISRHQQIIFTNDNGSQGWLCEEETNSVRFLSIDDSNGGSPYKLREYVITAGGVTDAQMDILNAPPVRLAIAGTAPTISPQDNSIYLCGELSGLTISTCPASGDFTVIFTSGATATTLSVPQTMHLPDAFSVEANKRYEINVSDGYAVVASWPMEVSQ